MESQASGLRYQAIFGAVAEGDPASTAFDEESGTIYVASAEHRAVLALDASTLAVRAIAPGFRQPGGFHGWPRLHQLCPLAALRPDRRAGRLTITQAGDDPAGHRLRVATDQGVLTYDLDAGMWEDLSAGDRATPFPEAF